MLGFQVSEALGSRLCVQSTCFATCEPPPAISNAYASPTHLIHRLIYIYRLRVLHLTARGPGAQALGRAMKYKPDMKASYGILLDSYKVEFRRAWMSTKSFEFVTTTRTTSNSFKKRRDEVGTFKTKLQIEQILGGSDNRLPTTWACACGLKADTYFWVEQLVTSTQEWTQKVCVACKQAAPGSWEEKVRTCKAIRAYAYEKGCKVADVTAAQVEANSWGIEGYAKHFEVTPEAHPRPGSTGARSAKRKGDSAPDGPDGSEASKPLTKNGPNKDTSAPNEDSANKDEHATKKAKKDNTSARKEKEAKELLAQEQASDNSMTVTAAEITRNPQRWTWAKDAAATCRAGRKWLPSTRRIPSSRL